MFSQRSRSRWSHKWAVELFINWQTDFQTLTTVCLQESVYFPQPWLLFVRRMHSHTQTTTVCFSWRRQPRRQWTWMKFLWLSVCYHLLLFHQILWNKNTNLRNISLVCLFATAKKLPKSEPQPAVPNTGRNRGVDLTETAQPAKASCCSNWRAALITS